MLLALILAADVHLALSAGAGVAHDWLGAHFEVRVDHFAAFAGTGASSISGAFNEAGLGTYGGVFGARWFSGDGDRLFLSAQYDFTTSQDCASICGEGPPGPWTHFSVATATVGWRFKWDGFFADAGAGGGLSFNERNACAPRPIPDLTLAVGWEF